MDMDPTPTIEPRRPVSAMRRIVIVALTLLAALLVTAPTVALTLGRRDSALGSRFWPINADVQARRAAELVATDLKPPTLAQADALSRAALRREPINVMAARIQAIVAAARGQERSTAAWLAYAERLSRRDFGVQTMLIELAVTRNDIPGALVHYDRALRTKRAAGDVLYPILFGAASEPDVLPALARLLGKRPEWWYDFTVKWQNSQPPVAPLFTILMAERPDIASPRERQLVVTAMRQMVAANRIDLAARLHDRVVPAGTPIAGRFVDGRFDSDDALSPFAWDITSEPGLAGAPEQRGQPARPALTIDVGGDQGGIVAQQLVRLAPGQYRLAFRVGEVVADGVVPGVSILCTGAGEPLIDQHIAPEGPALRSVAFRIDRGCLAQTIRVGGTAGGNDSLPRPWITDMVVRRLD